MVGTMDRVFLEEVTRVIVEQFNPLRIILSVRKQGKRRGNC